jgi:hypothetical protein
MSHVQELYRQEALGLISSREFDRRFDDAVEQDMIDSMAQRDLDAEYEAYIREAEKEYYEDIINSMPPHDRKHELNPGRMDLKGGHRHNHIRNAHKRMRKCHVCDDPIVWGCEVISDWTNAEFMCRECCRNDAKDYCSAVGIHFGGVTFQTRRKKK